MKFFYTLLLVLVSLSVISQTPAVMTSQPNLTYTENFTDILNWSFNPNNDGTFVSGIGSVPWKGVAANGTTPIPSGPVITLASTYFSFSYFGGVQRDSLNRALILLTPGTTDNTNSTGIDLNLDFTGVDAGTLSFSYQMIRNSTGDRKSSVRVYASTDGIVFNEITAAQVLNITNNVTNFGTILNVALPASFNNAPKAIIRFYAHNGSGGAAGSRPKISIDNVKVTALSTTPCTAPTAQPTGLIFSNISDKAITGSFTAANPASDNYLVIQSKNPALSALPVNGTTYVAGDNIGDGTVVTTTAATTFTATGLSASTTYYFFVFATNRICAGGPSLLQYYTINYDCCYQFGTACMYYTRKYCNRTIL